MTEDNPHHIEYEAARDVFHEADRAVNDFRNYHVDELVAELAPEADHAIDRLRAAGEQWLSAAQRLPRRTQWGQGCGQLDPEPCSHAGHVQ